jgi:transposase
VVRQRRLPIQQILAWSTCMGAKLISSGVVEGLNNKAKITLRKSCRFRTYRALELALFHSLGKLPEPGSAHDFF